jgi:hypothetical protein
MCGIIKCAGQILRLATPIEMAETNPPAIGDKA